MSDNNGELGLVYGGGDSFVGHTLGLGGLEWSGGGLGGGRAGQGKTREGRKRPALGVLGHANQAQIWAGFGLSRTPRPSVLGCVRALGHGFFQLNPSGRVSVGWVDTLEMALAPLSALAGCILPVGERTCITSAFTIAYFW
jgi:hypothetical protein